MTTTLIKTLTSKRRLTQNLNLRTHLKIEYNKKSVNYNQENFSVQA